MRRILLACALILVFVSPLLRGQEPLTNDAVVKLAKAGLSEEVILGMVKLQPAKYSLTPKDILELKSAGVSDKVIAAMLERMQAGSVPKPRGDSTAGRTTSSPGAGQFTEVGVYYRKSGEWMEVLPEVVNWATGGTIKNLASAGVVKKDVNGRIPGAHSRNSVALPAEFVIRAPESVSITEYQLLRLRLKQDFREFRTVTGGVFNQRGGATRDMVPFEGKKIGERLFSVILPNNLGAGDYGFLWGGAAGAAGSQASLSMGKMYTFRVIE